MGTISVRTLLPVTNKDIYCLFLSPYVSFRNGSCVLVRCCSKDFAIVTTILYDL